ncbi:MAG: hypothetical protein IJK18_00680 [Clostridia bacterium]|nr:hypothetical protein [Clostridia bacterium]
MEGKSGYETYNEYIDAIIDEAYRQSKFNDENSEVAYVDEDDGTELLHCVVDGLHLYYDEKTKIVQISKEELYKKGENERFAGVVIMSRYNRNQCELQCEDPSSPTDALLYMAYYSSEGKKYQGLCRKWLPTAEFGIGRAPKMQVVEDLGPNMEDLLKEAFEATPPESKKYRDAYESAIDLVGSIREVAEKARKNNNPEHEESNTENLEELSVEELEAKLGEIRKLNDEKSEELKAIEQQRKKELLEKIRAAQQEGKDLDEQIAKAKGKRIGNR